MDSFDELKSSVEANQNVLSVRMELLRDIFGVRRLGIHVCTEIGRKLAGVGLGHYPEELQADAWQEVRVYKLGTPMAELLRAANQPGKEQDAVLRSVAQNDAAEVLEQVKALVCD